MYDYVFEDGVYKVFQRGNRSVAIAVCAELHHAKEVAESLSRVADLKDEESEREAYVISLFRVG